MNWILGLLPLLALCACAAETHTASAPDVANPAAVFCEEQGYDYESYPDFDGEGTRSVCIFPDGAECEAWAFFEGECDPINGPS